MNRLKVGVRHKIIMNNKITISLAFAISSLGIISCAHLLPSEKLEEQNASERARYAVPPHVPTEAHGAWYYLAGLKYSDIDLFKKGFKATESVNPPYPFDSMSWQEVLMLRREALRQELEQADLNFVQFLPYGDGLIKVKYPMPPGWGFFWVEE
jgi:hypothetical protein